MSRPYWAGYHGDALVLNEEEFEAFCECYVLVNGLVPFSDDADEMEERVTDYVRGMFDNEPIREYSWKCAVDKQKTFQIVDVLVDECDGMVLEPFLCDGHINQNGFDEQGNLTILWKSHHLRCNNCYVVFADKNRCNGKAFFEPPYTSYGDFKQEFVGKLKDYLPDDFNWDIHLGHFRYAAYA